MDPERWPERPEHREPHSHARHHHHIHRYGYTARLPWLRWHGPSDGDRCNTERGRHGWNGHGMQHGCSLRPVQLPERCDAGWKLDRTRRWGGAFHVHTRNKRRWRIHLFGRVRRTVPWAGSIHSDRCRGQPGGPGHQRGVDRLFHRCLCFSDRSIGRRTASWWNVERTEPRGGRHVHPRKHVGRQLRLHSSRSGALSGHEFLGRRNGEPTAKCWNKWFPYCMQLRSCGGSLRAARWNT